MNSNSEQSSQSQSNALSQSIQVIALISFVFSLLMGSLLSINYLRFNVSDPLENKLLLTLNEQLYEQPNNEVLKSQIRDLDLLARKAYFSAQWQISTGSRLFIGGIVCFLSALFVLNRINQRPRLPNPSKIQSVDEKWSAKQRTVWVYITSSSLLCVFALFGVLMPRFDLKNAVNHDLESNSENVAVIPEFDLELGKSLTWPGFRGHGGNAIVEGFTVSQHWNVDTGKGIKWKTEISRPGYNSPIVWGDRIFISGADDQAKEIYCYDKNDGALIWSHQVGHIPGSGHLEEVYEDTGRAAPSLATNGKYVCAIFANGDLVCVDTNGNEIWSSTLGVPDNHYGHSSSLLIHKNLVFVQWDQGEDPKLLAYHLDDGSLVWQVKRYAISWSSPICVNTGERNELILTDSESVSSYNPETGEEYWRAGDVSGGEMGPSAFYNNGIVFAATDMSVATAIQLNGSSDPEVLWEFDEHLPDTASLIGNDDFCFIATSYSMLACVSIKTGELVWEAEVDEGFYSSPVLVGDLIYVWDLEGVAHIFRASEKYELIAKIPTGEPVVATPAFVEKSIILRSQNNLICIDG